MNDAQILVVDDETRAVELLARALRNCASVTTAGNAQDAMDAVATQRFDVVISDQRMPGMTGVEFLSTVASQAPDTGRILLTAFADHAAAVSAINDARIHAYVRKPFVPEELRITVATVRGRCETERRNHELAGELRRLELEHAAAVEELKAIRRSGPGEKATEPPRGEIASLLDELAALARSGPDRDRAIRVAETIRVALFRD